MTYIEELYKKGDIEKLKNEKTKVEKIILEYKQALEEEFISEVRKEKIIKNIEEEKRKLEKVEKYLTKLLSSKGNT